MAHFMHSCVLYFQPTSTYLTPQLYAESPSRNSKLEYSPSLVYIWRISRSSQGTSRHSAVDPAGSLWISPWIFPCPPTLCARFDVFRVQLKDVAFFGSRTRLIALGIDHLSLARGNRKRAPAAAPFAPQSWLSLTEAALQRHQLLGTTHGHTGGPHGPRGKRMSARI